MLDRTAFNWIAEAEDKTDEALALIKRMASWFLDNYENPAMNTPYDGCGGPYLAREELAEEFSDLSENLFSQAELEETIELSIREIEREVGDCFEWAKILRDAHHGVRLLRANDHYWGKGHVHHFDADLGKTTCGKRFKSCPGDMDWGAEDEITCKACLSKIKRREPSCA